MKNDKLKLNKFKIIELKNPIKVVGGNNTDTGNDGHTNTENGGLGNGKGRCIANSLIFV
jgi:hypothetical protein